MNLFKKLKRKFIRNKKTAVAVNPQGYESEYEDDEKSDAPSGESSGGEEGKPSSSEEAATTSDDSEKVSESSSGEKSPQEESESAKKGGESSEESTEKPSTAPTKRKQPRPKRPRREYQERIYDYEEDVSGDEKLMKVIRAMTLERVFGPVSASEPPPEVKTTRSSKLRQMESAKLAQKKQAEAAGFQRNEALLQKSSETYIAAKSTKSTDLRKAYVEKNPLMTKTMREYIEKFGKPPFSIKRNR